MVFFKSFFGISLRTSTLIVGGGSLVLSMICCILLAFVSDIVQDEVTKEMVDFSTCAATCTCYLHRLGNVTETLMLKQTFVTGIIIEFSVMATISMLTSILLIIGASKGQTWLLLPWIAHVFFAIMENSTSLIYYAIKFRDEVALDHIFILLLIVFGAIAVCLLSLLVVASYFDEATNLRKISNYNLLKSNPDLENSLSTTSGINWERDPELHLKEEFPELGSPTSPSSDILKNNQKSEFQRSSQSDLGCWTSSITNLIGNDSAKEEHV